MRTAEWANLLFFSLMGALSLLRPLQRAKRVKVLLIGALGVGFVVAAQFLDRFLSPLAASIIRDWLPAPLILLAYHQGGQFFSRPRESLQSWLLRTDHRLFEFLKRRFGTNEIPRSVRVYLEVAYILCYPLVPMGIAVLYLANMRQCADAFWRIVLPPAYLCYAMIPFFPTLPPWLVNAERAGDSGASPVRSANFFVLRHLSIGANTFPSAHVAASIATALALLGFVPVAGIVFLWIAISITISTVAGRYHYALDAATGAALALLTSLLGD